MVVDVLEGEGGWVRTLPDGRAGRGIGPIGLRSCSTVAYGPLMVARRSASSRHRRRTKRHAMAGACPRRLLRSAPRALLRRRLLPCLEPSAELAAPCLSVGAADCRPTS